ncbi:hypothetical protein WICPIJ_000151 [Wickerhamomyces pijperi]|uniref:Uncharacterized protein n=1 Tax=Wickerhamomyces pijperi TaxID=599730 RepID=A0A9P8QH56_WICPI|nr:hypothetical protein WICPIJ_000151 [Wickerhamomyces pijperi]
MKNNRNRERYSGVGESVPTERSKGDGIDCNIGDLGEGGMTCGESSSGDWDPIIGDTWSMSSSNSCCFVGGVCGASTGVVLSGVLGFDGLLVLVDASGSVVSSLACILLSDFFSAAVLLLRSLLLVVGSAGETFNIDSKFAMARMYGIMSE